MGKNKENKKKNKSKKKDTDIILSNGRRYDISKRDHYLDLAGIPAQEYGVNFTFDDDERRKQWKKQRAKYGFDEREIWNLDSQFLQWIYSRCMFFLEHELASDNVVIEFEDKTYTQLAALEEICSDALYALENQYAPDAEKAKEAVYRMCRAARIWAEVLPAMWC